MIWPLILTIFLEFFPIFLLRQEKDSLGRIIFVVIAINLITNPIANLIYPQFPFLAIEVAVVLAETALFALMFDSRLKEGFILSLSANLLSMGAGIAISALGIHPGF